MLLLFDSFDFFPPRIGLDILTPLEYRIAFELPP